MQRHCGDNVTVPEDCALFQSDLLRTNTGYSANHGNTVVLLLDFVLQRESCEPLIQVNCNLGRLFERFSKQELGLLGTVDCLF
jgi:hypothetical protein